MKEITKIQKITNCKICGEKMQVVVFIDDEGNEEYQDICNFCAEDYFVNHERDKLREGLGEDFQTWSELLNQKKMDEKLGSRQYAKLEPAQKIFNTLIMTLGPDWLRENLNIPDKLKNLVDLSVELADRLVEKLYEEQKS